MKNKRNVIYSVIVLLAVVVNFALQAQQKNLETKVMSSEGPKSIVRTIKQDKKGNIWITSWEGVFKYDGKSAGIITIAKNGYILGGLSFLAFVGFIFFRSVKPRRVLPDAQHTDTFSLGSVLFDSKNRKLMMNENTIELTGTETRVLLIFALSPNETIERSRLQKEIWEDEGVIVGRSLDMFISKLRKKTGNRSKYQNSCSTWKRV